jgi:hypothetical protein
MSVFNLRPLRPQDWQQSNTKLAIGLKAYDASLNEIGYYKESTNKKESSRDSIKNYLK